MATARKALIVTAVGVGVVAVALALWKIQVVIALLFVAVTIAAAMRPGVEALEARRRAFRFATCLRYRSSPATPRHRMAAGAARFGSRPRFYRCAAAGLTLSLSLILRC